MKDSSKSKHSEGCIEVRRRKFHSPEELQCLYSFISSTNSHRATPKCQTLCLVPKKDTGTLFQWNLQSSGGSNSQWKVNKLVTSTQFIGTVIHSWKAECPENAGTEPGIGIQLCIKAVLTPWGFQSNASDQNGVETPPLPTKNISYFQVGWSAKKEIQGMKIKSNVSERKWSCSVMSNSLRPHGL